MTVFAVAALVLGPPLEYLRYNHYPLLSPEVLLPTAIWFVCAIGIGSYLNRASRPVRIIAFTLLLLVFVDWQFSGHVALSFRLVPLLVVAVVWLLERHLETTVAVVLAGFYVTSLPTSSPNRATTVDFPSVQRDTSLPPVLYIIVDEHIGIEGWPAEFASAQAMERRTREFYLGEGFRLFGRAYSEYAETESSVPAALNWPVEDPHQDVEEVGRDAAYRVRSNGLFTKLGLEGYRIRVYQSTYMDFCDGRVSAIRSCETSPGNSIRNLSLHHRMALWPKARMVFLYFLEYNSRFYAHLRELYSGLAQRHETWPRWGVPIAKSVFPAAMELLDRLQADLRADDPRGTLYFAHLLAPHHPYEVDANCRPQTHPSRWLEIIPWPDRGVNTPLGRAQRYDLYAAQVGCLYRRLEGLLREIDSMPAGRRMVVVMFGDHGSRITLHYPLRRLVASLQPSDFSDAFSALFAIRAPGIPAGYDRRFVPISELAGNALASGFQRIDLPETERHQVKVETGMHTPYLTLPLSDTALKAEYHARVPVAPATRPLRRPR